MKSILRFFKASIFISCWLCTTAWAYPEFIGYGYSSCVTCHYNSHGSGVLNDYGRALWSGEIASRSFYSKQTSDEQIAEVSGFAGKPENLPWWLRPGIKYRGLWNKTQFTSANSQTKFYLMQMDINTTLLLDPDAQHILSYTAGSVPLTVEDAEKSKLNRFLAREYYYRGNFFENHWLYVGMMDKVFGIRNIDHTSFARRPQRLSLKDDQTVSAVYHYIKPEWEASAQYFVGGAYEESDAKLKGASLKGEYEFAEKQRGALSFLTQKNTAQKIELLGAEYRYGFQKGAAVMTEFGFIADDNISTNVKKTGSWFLLETWLPITRGYNFRTVVERYNDDFKPSADDQWRWDLGLIMFPAPRIEFRLDLLQGRALKNTGGADDSWTMQGQLHVSL